MRCGILWMIGMMLSGCASHHAAPPVLPSLRPEAPVKFNVASVQVVLSVEPYFKSKLQENAPYPDFKSQIEQWAERTFKCKGHQGTLYVIIEHACVQEDAIAKKTQGIQGFFTHDQSEAYRAALGVRLELKDHLGQTLATTLTTAEHGLTVLENISLAQREQEISRLIHLLIVEINEKIRANIHENMIKFLQ